MGVPLETVRRAPAGAPPPSPSPAAVPAPIAAPPGRRALAFAIDVAGALVFSAPALVGFSLLFEVGGLGLSQRVAVARLMTAAALLAAGALLPLAWALVQLALHGMRGLTLGKRLAGLRSVNAVSLGRPGFWRVVLRAVVLAAAWILVPAVGVVPLLLSPLWGPRGRGWLDLVGDTWCLDVRRGPDPFSPPPARVAAVESSDPAALEPAVLGSATGELARLLGPQPRERTDPPPPPATEPGLPVPVAAEPAVPEPLALAAAASAPETAAVPAVAPAASRAALPAEAPTRLTSAVPGSWSAMLVLDDGTRFEVCGAGLLGRNPTPEPGEEPRHLIAVPDPERTVSKTHAAFGRDERGFWVLDRSSRNGTGVRSAEGGVQTAAGRRVYVGVGDTVLLARRSLTVEFAG